MEDEKIIELFWQRNQAAIKCTEDKYGRLCRKISCGILSSPEDAEECVSDTYLALWNSIPPQRPDRFRVYVAAVTRNLSLLKLRERYSKKRGGGEMTLVLDELGDSFSSDCSPEREYEEKEAAEAINSFLYTLSENDRNIFISRYWLFMPVADIALNLNCSKSRVATSLFRTRQKLQRYLLKEGLV